MLKVSKNEKSIAGLLVVALVLTSATVGIFAMMNSTSANPDSSPNADPVATLNVLVVNSTGAPIFGASVLSFAQPTGQVPLSGFTDSNGTVSFTNLVAGDYMLAASKSGFVNGFGNATVQDNETASITIVLSSAPSSPTQLLLSASKQEYLVNESVSITAVFLNNGQPVNMALTSVEVRDPSNNLVYISTGQTQNGTCTFGFKSELTWLTGDYSVFGASFLNGVGSALATTSFRMIKLVSDVRIVSAWVFNPEMTSGQNLTLGPLGQYWSIGELFNYGNGSAFVSSMTFEYPANLAANSIQAIFVSPFDSPVPLNYTQVGNTISISDVTLLSHGYIAIIVDTDITHSASYTSTTTANWQDTNLLFEASGTKSLTLDAVWDTANPVIITSFANTGTNSTGGFINIDATLNNVGVSNVTLVCVVQVADSSGVPLTPVIQPVNLVPGSQVVSITVNIPSSSPKGMYVINFALYTDLPSNGGHAINYEQTTAVIQ